jgi:hypothetical protein
LVRAHEHTFVSTEFDPRTTGDRRFSPLTGESGVVSVLYAGTDDRTAAAETVFDRLPGGGRPRRVPLARCLSWQWSQVHPTRDLHLLALDAGLPDATDRVDGDALTHARSQQRAAALLRRNPDADGLVWESRQLHDRPSTAIASLDSDGLCLLLLTTTTGRTGGVARYELTADGPAIPFAPPIRRSRASREFFATVTRARRKNCPGN